MVKRGLGTLVSMGWKTAQKKDKVKKNIKLALIVLGLILGLILTGNIISLTNTLFSPRVTSSRNYTWNKSFNLNLLVKKESSIFVLVFNPTESKLSIVTIPDQTLVWVSEGFGSWQIRAVYDLAGIDVLKQTVSTFLGLPVDGFLELDSDIKLGKDFLNLFNLSSLKTDLTPFELLSLKMGLSSVRFDKVEEIDLTDVLDQTKLADGTEVFSADPVRVDSIVSSLSDPTLKQENKSIAIFNGTNKLGLAQSVARMVSNMGGDVIITSNTENFKKTQVVGEQSQTLRRLKQILDKCKEEEEGCGKIAEYEGRAQINIILGED